MGRAREVLEFWFGTAPMTAERLRERTAFWFGGEGAATAAERDELIRDALESMLQRAARGELASWAETPKRRLALIILFDQVPRNVYRGTAAAFSFDDRALALTVEGMELGADRELEILERLFFYLPLEHAESLDRQRQSVAAYERLVAESPPELREYCGGTLQFARAHFDIVAQFGRFPYRNAVLGRESTAAELAWLAANADRFGQ